jgi:hypothetical protein
MEICVQLQAPRKQLTVTMGGPLRQLQHGDDRKSVFGYQLNGTERKLSHSLYVDDLKLLSRNEDIWRKR